MLLPIFTNKKILSIANNIKQNADAAGGDGGPQNLSEE